MGAYVVPPWWVYIYIFVGMPVMHALAEGTGVLISFVIMLLYAGVLMGALYIWNWYGCRTEKNEKKEERTNSNVVAIRKTNAEMKQMLGGIVNDYLCGKPGAERNEKVELFMKELYKTPRQDCVNGENPK